jgi:cytochrome d ubiquinol oxidase subunit I
MGRQPWVVYGLLRTSDALSKSVQANQVLFSLILFFIVYSILLLLFIYLMNKGIKNGPYDEENYDEGSLNKAIAGVVLNDINK